MFEKENPIPTESYIKFFYTNFRLHILIIQIKTAQLKAQYLYFLLNLHEDLTDQNLSILLLNTLYKLYIIFL